MKKNPQIIWWRGFILIAISAVLLVMGWRILIGVQPDFRWLVSLSIGAAFIGLWDKFSFLAEYSISLAKEGEERGFDRFYYSGYYARATWQRWLSRLFLVLAFLSLAVLPPYAEIVLPAILKLFPFWKDVPDEKLLSRLNDSAAVIGLSVTISLLGHRSKTKAQDESRKTLYERLYKQQSEQNHSKKNPTKKRKKSGKRKNR